MQNKLNKYFQGELSTNEKLELFREMKCDLELQKQFIEYKNLNSLFSYSFIPDDFEDSQEAYLRFRTLCAKIKKRRLVLNAMSYAATCAILIASTYLITTKYFAKTNIPEANNTLYVPAGQRLKITLADGTDVWLNAQTKLTYPVIFTGEERRVILDGEAYFDVAKDETKPFIVSTHDIELKVLGTEFNVYSYSSEDYSQTSLINGSLEVYLKDQQSKAVKLKPNDQVTISNKQIQSSQLSLPKDTNTVSGKVNRNTMHLGKITNTEHFLWKDGIYSFENELLVNILKKLEIYYDVEFMIEDSSIYQWEYTGKFRQQDGIDKILDMIRRIHNFDITKNEKTNIIILDKSTTNMPMKK